MYTKGVPKTMWANTSYSTGFWINQSRETSSPSIVSYIFDGIISSKGLIEIVRELNAKGIPGPKGKGWGRTGAYIILTYGHVVIPE